MRRPWLRWMLLAGLLVLASAAALWPRDASGPVAEPASGMTGSSSTKDGLGGPAPDLEKLRAAADLAPCPQPTSDTQPSGPLAGLELPCLGTGGRIDLGAALAGRPALLNLWGPLCRPCVEELPTLAAYAEQPGSIPVIGVEVQALPAGGLDLLAELDVHFPSFSDPDGALRGALGSPPVLPLTYLVAADGRVMQVNPPKVFHDPAQVRAAVQHYLGPGAGR